MLAHRFHRTDVFSESQDPSLTCKNGQTFRQHQRGRVQGVRLLEHGPGGQDAAHVHPDRHATLPEEGKSA